MKKMVRRILSAGLAAVLVPGLVLASGLSGGNTAEAAKIGSASLEVSSGSTIYEYVYTGDTGDAMHARVHWVNGDTKYSVYCTQFSKSFNEDGDYESSHWSENACYSEMAYAIYHGCTYYGKKSDSDYTTDSWIKDYYATQVVVWCIREDYGYDGVNYDSLQSISGYEDVYKEVKALYKAVKKYAGSDGYGDEVALSIEEPSSTVMTLNSSKTYYKTGWYSLDTAGTLYSTTVKLVNAPDGAEIVYEDEDDPESRFYIRIPVGDAQEITDASTTFTVKVTARYKRPLVYIYASEDSGDQNVTYLHFEVDGDTLSDKASVTLELAETGIEIYKKDSETGNGVAGASYGVYSDEACTDLTAVLGPTDESGYASVSFVLRQDTYYVKETQASEAYLVNTAADAVSVVLAESTSLETAEDQAKGQIIVSKADADTESSDPQGNASLAGAVYGLYAAEDIEHPDKTTGIVYQAGDLVQELTLPDSGTAAFSGLYFGSYYVKEISAPEGYLADKTEYPVTLTYADQETAVVTERVSVYEEVIRGGVSIKKKDSETGDSSSQGNAVLSGAEFEIVNLSEAAVTVEGVSYEPGEAVMKISTDADGLASTDADQLPYGHYSIQEVKAPEGYLLTDGTAYEFDITQNGVTVSAGADGEAVCDQIIRGGVKIRKLDAETGENSALGNAMLLGTCFEIVNLSEEAVLVDGVSYEPGETVAEISTDAEGLASTDADLLPFGHYSIREVSAPTGYLLTDGTAYEFDIAQDGKIVTAGAGGSSVSDQVIRGDFEFVKVKELTGEWLSDIAFLVTSETTGESHVVVTDENGYVNTSSENTAHTTATNANDAALSTDEDGNYVVDESLLDASAGVWFGLAADGSMTEADDALGALPYDTYTITELSTSANADLIPVSFTVAISQDQVTVDIGTIDDPSVPAIGTSAKDAETESPFSCADGEVTLIDEVSYLGLTVGETYTLYGTLMNRETGTPVLDAEGNEVTAEKTFTAAAKTGTVEMVYTFDGSSLAGATTVFFETLTDSEGEWVASHEDLTDDGQTIWFPSIQTTAADSENGTHETDADEEVTIIDTVSYENLNVGTTYRLHGVLYVRETGEVLLDAEGNEVTSDAVFTAETESGSIDMSFTFDASLLGGTTTVVFETLSYNEKTVAVHADLEDEGQSVFLTELPEKTPVVKTADSGSMTRWVLLALAGAVCAAGAVFGKRHRGRA